MRRSWTGFVAVMPFIGLAACSGAGSVSASSTVTSHQSAALAWLNAKAEPWNSRMNSDQIVIAAATKKMAARGQGADSSPLLAACLKLSDDAAKASGIPDAPLSSGLIEVWLPAATSRATYGADCVLYLSTGSASDLATWTASIADMNATTDRWNVAVAAIRSGKTSIAG